MAFEDRVNQNLRDTLRTLTTAQIDFELRRAGVRVAIRQVEFTTERGNVPGTIPRDVLAVFTPLFAGPKVDTRRGPQGVFVSLVLPEGVPSDLQLRTQARPTPAEESLDVPQHGVDLVRRLVAGKLRRQVPEVRLVAIADRRREVRGGDACDREAPAELGQRPAEVTLQQ